MSSKINILIVDDSPFYRDLLTSSIRKSARVQIAGVAADGEQAIQAVLRVKPDLILLDLEMPRMDGFTFLRWLMVNFPLPVIVVSSKADVHSTFKALELGAADFLEKPAGQEAGTEFDQQLIRRIEVVAQIPIKKLIKRTELFRDTRVPLNVSPAIEAKPSRNHARLAKPVRAVVIGASTGGPTAIFSIIPSLPKDFPLPICIAQHMPGGFTKSFAERLNKLSKLEVYEAQGGEPVEPGKVYIAPGGYHLLLEARKGTPLTVLKAKGPEDRFAPSVDALMISASSVFKGSLLGILLTGMGNDGLEGMRRIKSEGGTTLAESEETAVVFGMPREAIEAGVVDEVAALGRIPAEMMALCAKANLSLPELQ